MLNLEFCHSILSPNHSSSKIPSTHKNTNKTHKSQFIQYINTDLATYHNTKIVMPSTCIIQIQAKQKPKIQICILASFTYCQVLQRGFHWGEQHQ